MTEHLPLSLQDGAEETLAGTDAQDPEAPTGALCAEKVSVAGRCPPPPGVSALTSKGGDAKTELTSQLQARGFSEHSRVLFSEGCRSDGPKPDLHKHWKDIWLHPQYLFCLLSHLHRRKNNYFQNLKNVSRELKFNPNLLGKQRCPDAVYRQALPRGGAPAPCRPPSTLSKWRRRLRRRWGLGRGPGCRRSSSSVTSPKLQSGSRGCTVTSRLL